MGRESWNMQRGLAEIFEVEDGPLSTLELAARFYEVEASGLTAAQLSSVRRALNALARKGVLWASRRQWQNHALGDAGEMERGARRSLARTVTTPSARSRVKRHPEGNW